MTTVLLTTAFKSLAFTFVCSFEPQIRISPAVNRSKPGDLGVSGSEVGITRTLLVWVHSPKTWRDRYITIWRDTGNKSLLDCTSLRFVGLSLPGSLLA